METTPEGKVRLYDPAGNCIERWPVDAHDIVNIAGGAWLYERRGASQSATETVAAASNLRQRFLKGDQLRSGFNPGAPIPMRYRTDSSWIAQAKDSGDTYELWYPGCPHHADGSPDCGLQPTAKNRIEWDNVPAAVPGDTWQSLWHGNDAVAGYGTCCPKCYDIHYWTTATNCSSIKERQGTKSDGTHFTYRACDHSGVGSCWIWSGSPEQNLLTAQPSLYCVESKGGCGWHGFLTNGIYKHC